jgi:hypothetical protein
MELELSLHPNPFENEISLVLFIDTTVIVIVSLCNASGEVIRMLSWTLQKGENHIQIDDLEHLSPGKFSLEVRLLSGALIRRVDLYKKTDLYPDAHLQGSLLNE